MFGGNKEFSAGVRKPPGRGKAGSFSDEDDLPNLVEKELEYLKTDKPQRAGFTTVDTPTRPAIRRTMRNSLGRADG